MNAVARFCAAVKTSWRTVRSAGLAESCETLLKNAVRSWQAVGFVEQTLHLLPGNEESRELPLLLCFLVHAKVEHGIALTGHLLKLNAGTKCEITDGDRRCRRKDWEFPARIAAEFGSLLL